MFSGWQRERRIRKVLAGLARQRVALVMQPGNVWVIENALERNGDAEANLMTCLMRGWVEPLHEDMPTGQLTPDLEFPSGALFTTKQSTYRLTEGGWAALNRAHAWTLVGVSIAALSLIAGIATIA